MNTLKCFVLFFENQHIKNFIENVESSLPFVATTGRRQQRRATICGVGKYFFFILVLARARSVKLVSGVFHY